MAGCSGVDRPRPVWGADDACLVTELRHFPTGAFEVHVLIAAGNMETLVNEIIKRVEAWGRHIGALFVTIASRKGWEKIMRPYGYEHWQTELRQDLYRACQADRKAHRRAARPRKGHNLTLRSEERHEG